MRPPSIGISRGILCVAIAASLRSAVAAEPNINPFAAHEIIARKAAFALPDEIKDNFLPRLDSYIEAVRRPGADWPRDPKLRGRSDWHYLRIDLLATEQSQSARLNAWERFPRERSAARRLGMRRGPVAIGDLPWALERLQTELAEAFRDGDWDVAVEAAGHLTHFATDAIDPFRCTVNVDGVETGNLRLRDGAESRALGRTTRERFMEGLVSRHALAFEASIQLAGTEITAERSVVEAAFNALRTSLALHDRLCEIDRALTVDLGIDDAQSLGERRDAYFERLHQECSDIALERLRSGAALAGGLIVGAWEKSGRNRAAPKASADRALPPADSTSPGSTIVGSKNSEVFHKHDCSFANRISEGNLVRFASTGDAVRAGRRPCKVCRPE